MYTVTIRDAKARLNELISLAERGEEVVVMRGSKPAASIIPITGDDIELKPHLSDAQAWRIEDRIEEEARTEKSRSFPSPAEAVKFLRRIRQKP